ncbi:OmpP1/FadL family transporter [Marinifilum sp.]|uniref:OmpP1/FadL family transporter n=1 Tax=Marinifilum sp. TaxID=2033137 RepID=UPI003BA8EC64
MIKRICLAIAVIAMSYNLKAEGFAVNLQGNKQTGMGHVGTALNFDASSMQWNPGALATLSNKYSFSLGASLTLTETEYTGLGGTEKTDNPARPPFYFYGAIKVNDNLAFGLGAYTPFGNKVKWGDKWSGRYLIQDLSLKAIFIQPTVSYKVNNWLSIGAGMMIVKGDVELNRAVPVINPNDGSLVGSGKVGITGDKIEYGYNLGIFIQPNEKLSLGISYRSKVEMSLNHLDASADFSFPSEIPAPFQAAFPDGNVAVTLPLPSSFNLGFAYQINNKWLISADVNFIGWSEYESLAFDFENDPTERLSTPSARNWDNTTTWRFGAGYTANEKLDLYAGLYFDETPTNKMYYSPETPGANKVGVSAGFSYKLTNKLNLDASLLYNEGKKVTAAETNASTQQIYGEQGFAGEYKYRAWLPGIGITYNF